MKKRFTEEQIIGFLREAEAGLPIKELCRKHGFSEASYYLWKAKFGGMSVPEAKRGLSERRALRAARISASAYRYRPATDRNVALREQRLICRCVDTSARKYPCRIVVH